MDIKELKTKVSTIIEFLKTKGYVIENNPMAVISDDLYVLLTNEFRVWDYKSQSGAPKKVYNGNISNSNDPHAEIEIEEKPFFETFLVDFNDIKFKEGKVVFSKWFWQVGQSLELVIINAYIHKEFDSIKDYFQNTLGIKEIKVEIKAKNQVTFPHVKDMIVSSSDIARIDENIIDAIRISFIKKIIRKKSLAKSSYTIDKIFELTDNKEINANAFYPEDHNQLLDDILSIENKKHYNHLKYLSSKQSLSYKIHYLFKPYSFIFFLEGEEKNFFVWETLDTKEATYIWQIVKNVASLSEDFKKIEERIDSLRTGGKNEYIKNTDDLVLRIQHLYSEADKDFPKWRFDLDAYTK
ncbi:MAG: hypothetical protein ABI315_07725 [Bacteroidia bacterium]